MKNHAPERLEKAAAALREVGELLEVPAALPDVLAWCSKTAERLRLRTIRELPLGREGQPPPGIYSGVDFDLYLSWPYINNSSLTPALKSMAHYHAQEPREPSKAMRLGTFVHCGALEPSAVEARYVVMPAFEEQVTRPDGTKYDSPKASKAYKDLVAEFTAANTSKQIVTQDDYDKAVGICRALQRSPRAAEAIGPGCQTELSIVWDDSATGLRCKARLDAYSPERNHIADLKSTDDAGELPRAIDRYHYHRQAAMYSDGIEVLTGQRPQFWIVAVETAEPFAVRSAPVGLDTIEAGRQEYRRLLQRIAECQRSGVWPGYNDPDEWSLPESKLPPVELVVGGEIITV